MAIDSRIGIVGVGAMGGGMVKRLLDCGYKVCVYDISPANVEKMVELGAQPTESLASLASQVDIVLLSLPAPDNVRDVCLSKEGLINNLSPGKVLVELSSIDPNTIKEIAAMADKKGIIVFDVPVSGGPNEAAQGKLVLIVGSKKEEFERFKELFETMGSAVYYVGEIGMAKAVKLVNNTMSLGNAIVAAEAFVLGVKAGVDPDLLYDVLSNSGGRSNQFNKRFPNALKGNFDPAFAVSLGEKDMRLALQMATQVGAALPVTGVAQQLYSALIAAGKGNKDIVSIITMFEEWAGVEARGKR